MKNSWLSRRKFVASTAATAVAGLFTPAMRGEMQAAAPSQPVSRAAWMQEPRYAWGVMTHYLADWQARDHGLTMTPAFWNKLIDGFDVEAMAKRLEAVGVGHYQISIGQNSGYYLSPNRVYDGVTKARRVSAPGEIWWRIFTRPCTSATSS
jgi:hypothetical protein